MGKKASQAPETGATAVLSSCNDQGRLEIVATTLCELEQQEQAQRAARAWDGQ